jgi:hypothetical protein
MILICFCCVQQLKCAVPTARHVRQRSGIRRKIKSFTALWNQQAKPWMKSNRRSRQTASARQANPDQAKTTPTRTAADRAGGHSVTRRQPAGDIPFRLNIEIAEKPNGKFAVKAG